MRRASYLGRLRLRSTPAAMPSEIECKTKSEAKAAGVNATKSFDVCVLGRIGYDLYAVEQNRALAEVEHFSRHLGGSSANIAVGLARLGLRVAIISCVGKDLLADYLLDFLNREGINTTDRKSVV